MEPIDAAFHWDILAVGLSSISPLYVGRPLPLQNCAWIREENIRQRPVLLHPWANAVEKELRKWPKETSPQEIPNTVWGSCGCSEHTSKFKLWRFAFLESKKLFSIQKLAPAVSSWSKLFTFSFCYHDALCPTLKVYLWDWVMSPLYSPQCLKHFKCNSLKVATMVTVVIWNL